MVYLNNLNFSLIDNKIQFTDNSTSSLSNFLNNLTPGSLNIIIKANLEGTEFEEIKGLYISKSDPTKVINFSLQSNYLNSFSNQLNVEGSNTLQKVINYINTNKINTKISSDTETDELQATINVFQISVSLLLSITFILKNERAFFEQYNNLNFKLYNQTINIDLCNYNFITKIHIFSTALQKINSNNLITTLSSTIKPFHKLFILGENIDTIITLKQIYSAISSYYEWLDTNIYNTINQNKLKLYNEVTLFSKNINTAQNRYNDILSYCNNKILELNNYYIQQSNNLFVYQIFEDVGKNITECKTQLNKIIPMIKNDVIVETDKLILTIYDVIDQLLLNEKKEILNEFTEKKDPDIANIKSKIDELNDKLTQLLNKKISLNTEIAQNEEKIQKMKEDDDELHNDIKYIKLKTVLEGDFKRNSINIDNTKKLIAEQNEDLTQLQKNKKSQNNNVEIRISNKKKDAKIVLDSLKNIINNIFKTYKKYETYNNVYILKFVNITASFYNELQSSLFVYTTNIKDMTADLFVAIFKKYVTILENLNKCLLPIKDNNIIYNEFKQYEELYNKVNFHIDALFFESINIYERHNKVTSILSNNFYEENTFNDEINNFVDLEDIKVQNIHFEKAEYEFAINLLKSYITKLENKKKIIDNIMTYHDRITQEFKINYENIKSDVKVNNNIENNDILFPIDGLYKEDVSVNVNINELKKNISSGISKNEVINLIKDMVQTDSEATFNNIDKFLALEEKVNSISTQLEKVKELDNKMNSIDKKLDLLLKKL
jgi:hypothetical protein